MSIKEERERFRQHVVPALSEQISPWLRPLQASKPLSKRFVFLDDGQMLVVIVGDQENQNSVDRALAFGLAWQVDRDLLLVLPQWKANPTLHRVAFLQPGTRVFTHDGTTATEQLIPARHEVLKSYKDNLELSEKDLGARAAWVKDLIEWADQHLDLRSAHRPSYRAWHCLGRMVIRIQTTKKGLRVSAGVHAGSPSDKYTPLVLFDIVGALSESALTELQVAASAAIVDRLSGKDSDHIEHLLQSKLADSPGLLGLLPNQVGKPRRFFRELPCVRPGTGRNYIDLAGLDSAGTFHVVETKIGNDEMLILQGLDYYIWALAHREALAEHFGVPTLDIALDFVVASNGDGQPAIGPYTARQAEALDGSIRWRFITVTGWATYAPSAKKHRSRTVPSPPVAAPAVTGPRFVDRLHAHLAVAAGPLQPNGVSVVNINSLIHPAALHVWADLDKRKQLHKWAIHVRSSQAFAINLFGPLAASGAEKLLTDFFGPIAAADPPVFEFEDEADRLGESTSKRPHRTQVDVLLRGTAASGQPVALLIEVKLTEDDFGHCSAYTNPDNDRRDICAQPGAFGGNIAACFQLRNNGNGPRRRYDNYLAAPAESPSGCGCSFRLSASQPMRNLALAGVLQADGADVKFALCAPLAHGAIWRRWDAALAALTDERMVDLPAEHVLATHDESTATWLADRYQLGPSVP